ncbi:two component system response regulator [Martelella alba]|uniref:Two component system response regulator n=1 Tax=Martelella alba TaxID=2590451 RepID=A0ABY2SLK7_9HYPH|nr:two component system response regulator [Martelella alba]TKI04343.1 two component system response regulator [Martelella alba]
MPNDNCQFIKILIVDDHELIIAGIKSLFRPYAFYRIVGHAGNGLDVSQLCRQTMPDLVILDLGLPGMEGEDVITQLLRRWPSLRVVAHTSRQGEHHAARVFRLGAMAFVAKTSPARRLLEAVDAVCAGRRYIDPVLETRRVDQLMAEQESPSLSLTLRERQVLKQIAEGAGNRDIAARLSISCKTVETHRLNIMRKLDVHKATELILWSHRLGLVE